MSNLTDQSPSDSRLVRGVFYGWVMAPIVVIAHMCTLPGQSVGVAVFNESLRSDLSLNATQFSSAYAAGTVLASLLMTFVGALYDRFGMRRALFCVACAILLACQFMSTVSSVLMLFVAFFFLRLLCQGSLSLLASNTLAMWFQRTLGRVSGVVSVIATLAFGFLPLALKSLLESYGWRTTYQILGVAVAAILLPLLVIYRNRPEDMGQEVDGMGPEERAKFDAKTGTFDGTDWEYRDAIKQSSYWILIAVSVIWGLTGTAIIFDVQPIAAAQKVSWFQPEVATTIFFSCVAIAGLIGGFLADIFPLHRLAQISVGGMILGLAIMLFTSGNSLFAAYGVFGAAQGALAAVNRTIWVRYFGRANLGKIKGGAMTGMVAGSSLGPLISGLSFDQTGGFAMANGFFLALTIGALLALLFLRPPQILADSC